MPSSKEAKKTKADSTSAKKKTMPPQNAGTGAEKPEAHMSVSFINKLNEFILLNIELFAKPDEEKQKQYFDFIQQNIHIMSPLFFSAGEDFMKLVFKRTEASQQVQDAFIERWNTLRKLSEKIFQFVKLQVNLLVRKDPEKDQQEWKAFILENLGLMNEEFFRLGKKVFSHLLDQAIIDADIRSNFLEAWDQTSKTVLNLKEIPQKN